MVSQSPKENRSSNWLLLSTIAALLMAMLSFLLSPYSPHPSIASVTPSAPTPFPDLIRVRRTHYSLSDTLPVDKEKVVSLIGELIQAVPSAYNSQTNRAVVLFGEQHTELWDRLATLVEERTPQKQWGEYTSKRFSGFRGGAGTVLFFIDEGVVEDSVSAMPHQAENFPVWATQSDGMLQHAIWTGLATEGIGANLQHYNGLIDQELTVSLDLPSSWRLTAQLVFGGRVGEPRQKTPKPLEGKLKVFGA